MKKNFSVLILTILAFVSNAQSPNWAWVKAVGGIGHEQGYSITTDGAGNVYVAGFFTSPMITFDTITLINPDTTGVTGGIFVVKYDPSGNVLWAKGSGCVGGDAHLSITTDIFGSIYLTGHFVSSSITFGSINLINTPSQSGYSDIFIVKYSSIGNVIWAKSAGNYGNDVAKSVVTDVNGDVYITGFFDSPFIIFGTDTLTNTFSRDFFIVKYASLGNVLWAKGNVIPTGWDEGLSVTTDISGNLFLTGYFNPPTIAFDTLILNNIINASIGVTADIMVVKLDANGNSMWGKSLGGIDQDFGKCIITDPLGNIYVTGYFSSDSITIGTTTLYNATTGNSYDMFIVKFNASGDILWAKSAGGAGNDYGYDIKIDSSGNVYIAGNYTNTISFGTTTLNSNGALDIFLVKLDSLGNEVWIKGIGSIVSFSQDFGAAISLNNLNNIYITGHAGSSIAFGQDTLSFSNYSEMFVAKLDATTVGLNNKSLLSELVIYPNPSEGIFKLKHSSSIKTTEVFNIMGELVLRQGNENQINLQVFPKGLYFAKINGEHVIKLVKD